MGVQNRSRLNLRLHKHSPLVCEFSTDPRAPTRVLRTQQPLPLGHHRVALRDPPAPAGRARDEDEDEDEENGPWL
jgi:hypothetical protein